ncbi:MAG: amino acid ABC transporter ATP-binding protein, partial [Desulfobacterales bacterium]|nr:amino acid ABC transporter ATP-binding protein [Desulfobacterales bacterium]
MRTKSPVLRVENISKSLGGKEILRDVSLTVDKGELKLLIGP